MFPISLGPTYVPAEALAALCGCSCPSPRRLARLEPGTVLFCDRNPLLPGLGFCDPHARLAPDGRLLIYATHDASPTNTDYTMNDWWVWSTRDLAHWTFEGALRPEQTAIGALSSSCWATDALLTAGGTWWYLSDGPRRIRVMHGASPTGPWRDGSRRPLVAESDLAGQSRDPAVFADQDGSEWLLFGTWDFYLGRLGSDRVSFTEPPRRIEIVNPQGPYGPGRTDDKPFLHYRAGWYYLTWGCFSARSHSLLGPYDCDGPFFDPALAEASFARVKEFRLDRHGSFFDFDGRHYFIANDFSRTGASPFFRDSVIVPIEYRTDGVIAPAAVRTSWR
ncbi:MAG: family 43 glycosylhydrolase [candidate division WOR-3 bacterium]